MRKALGVAAALAAALVVAVGYKAQGQKMAEIRFELGKNIVETAKASGVPQFSARDVAGLVSYSINGIPAQIPARYTRPGYEVTWQPVFAFTMYADRDRGPDLKVETVALMLDIRGDSLDDAAAQAFVEQTIAQFQKGKWQRYANPDWDVLLTGRSSILDESGEIANTLLTIDPNYKIPRDDWPRVIAGLARWRWVGDGVYAELAVDNSPGVDGKPAYRMGLEFQLLDVMLKRDAENLARELAQGDTKGWGSTAKYEADKKDRAKQIKRLIANALERGDSVLPPQQ